MSNLDSGPAPLAGKRALVTGSSRGIGAEVALRLASHGAAVLVHHHQDAERAASVVQRVREASAGLGTVQPEAAVEADISDPAAVTAMFEAVAAEFGELDILVNNAGFGDRAQFFDVSEELWATTIGVNLGGTFRVSQAAARLMIPAGGGAIVNVSSVSSFIGSADQVHYTASKAGINGLTIGLAVALGEHGIRVNAVMPAGVATEMNRPAGFALQEWEQYGARHTPGTPINRYGTPGDVAAAVSFLVSGEARWITGALLPLDGGFGVMPRAVNTLRSVGEEPDA